MYAFEKKCFIKEAESTNYLSNMPKIFKHYIFGHKLFIKRKAIFSYRFKIHFPSYFNRSSWSK